MTVTHGIVRYAISAGTGESGIVKYATNVLTVSHCPASIAAKEENIIEPDFAGKSPERKPRNKFQG
ncbi:MAG: hypothetical protein B6245_09220 [Desulfobacteraceae bacterium 4572_88]|nr:MAG: hypothetical protein B6245_09220 [Desulfobacteraceae bacterium 4572_88]